MLFQRLCVFEFQAQNVCEVQEDMNKLLTIGGVGAQCGPVCRIGLRDKTFAILL